MDTRKENLQINMRIAALLGWTNLFQVNGAILGRPPGGSPHSRDQAAVPNWAGDFNHCCSLGLEYKCFPQFADVMAYANRNSIDLDNAYRHVMLEMVEAKRKREEKFDPHAR